MDRLYIYKYPFHEKYVPLNKEIYKKNNVNTGNLLVLVLNTRKNIVQKSLLEDLILNM